MIRINLLPDEFRIQTKSTQNLPVAKIAIASGILFGILTVYFFIDFLAASSELKKYENRWKQVQPQSQILTQLQQEVEGSLKQERDFMASFVTAERTLTSLLIWASEYLPDTAWLNELKMERSGEANSFFVKGLTLPSKTKSSIEQIESYLHQLKLKMPDMKLSLTTSRQIQENIELTQFTAIFDSGEKKKP